MDYSLRSPCRSTPRQVITVLALSLGSAVAPAASVRSADAPAAQAVPYTATPLPLSAVRLTGGPLKHAQDLTADYLLQLEPDRMLCHYRRLAGLAPNAEGYGGWDADGRQLTGHLAGHYLSAVSIMWAATGDQRFKQRAEYIVDQLQQVQQAHGDGFVGALENCQAEFANVSRGDIRSSGFDLNGLWSPWYTLHKTYAGLRDAYRYAGIEKALDVEVKFAEWAAGILAPMTDDQVQQMLNTEFGGMNEVLVDLYVDTGERRWLDLSYKFEHKAVLDPLKMQHDFLPGKHGNTQVPKLIGSLDRYAAIGDEGDGVAAKFFWDRVVNHHSFATGGHGKDEYFGPADRLSDFIDGRTAESCNVYNMLKLTRQLFALAPDEKYAAFLERALFNHILGSIDPATGATCYMVPVGQGVRREYADMFRSFTCCVGTGMESHGLHGDGIYYVSPEKLWVNLYAPSTAHWQEAGAKLTVETDFPEGSSASLKWELDAPREFTLALRRPQWAGDGFAVTVNGQEVADLSAPGSYVEIRRTWQSGDAVELLLPKQLHLESTPDNDRRVALMWGPLVLAGDLGAEEPKPNEASSQRSIPVFVINDRPVRQWLKPVEGKSTGEFATEGVGRERDVEFTPFYRLHHRTYGAYWDLFNESQWRERAAAIAAERQRLRQLESATVAFIRPGNMQSERDFSFQGEQAWPTHEEDRAGRYARGWFSFDVPVDAAHPMALVVTYRGGHRQRPGKFTISVDGTEVADVSLESDRPAGFYDATYEIPDELAGEQKSVTVRFEAKSDADVGPIFGIRMIRRDSPAE